MTQHLTIITGSSRGLGAALTALSLQPGQQVLGMARQHNAQLQAQADVAGVPLTQIQIDLADAPAAAARLQQWLQAFDGQVVASVSLINNAGLVGQPGPLHKLPLATLSAAMRVGLEAALLLSAAFLAATDGWPGARRIMNISSGLGRRAMAGSAAYCAAKAGMDHFSRALALEQAALPHGARVESIAPGVIDTDMQAELRGADAADFPEREMFLQLKASGQLMSPTDCASQLLARMNRADFGHEPVTDIRQP